MGVYFPIRVPVIPDTGTNFLPVKPFPVKIFQLRKFFPVFSPILFPTIKFFCLHPLLPSYPCSLPYLASTTSPMRPLSCTITVPLVPLCYLPSSRLLELATLRLSLASLLQLSCVTPLSLLLRPLATWMPAARASTLPVSPFLPPF